VQIFRFKLNELPKREVSEILRGINNILGSKASQLIFDEGPDCYVFVLDLETADAFEERLRSNVPPGVSFYEVLNKEDVPNSVTNDPAYTVFIERYGQA